MPKLLPLVHSFSYFILPSELSKSYAPLLKQQRILVSKKDRFGVQGAFQTQSSFIILFI